MAGGGEGGRGGREGIKKGMVDWLCVCLRASFKASISPY